MKVLELFAGERCIGKAFERKGHEVYSVEWDKSHPGCQCYQDVNNLTPEFILEQFGHPDVVWMSPDCFPAGTLIWTRNGYKPVEEINCFDEVLTHKNRYRRVYATQKTNKHDIYNIKISGCETVTVSSEHPYYVRKKLSRTTRIKGKSVRISGLDMPKWVKAKDLTTDYKVGIPINGESKIPQWHGCMYETKNSYGRTRSWIKNDLGKFMDNRDFWWVVGRYFGDGSLSASKYTVDITCAFDEVDEINSVLSNLDMKFSLYKKETASHFTICDKEWVEFLSQFGVGALEKQITPAILDLPVELLTAFLEGYISADGHEYSTENPRCSITTVSKKLAYGIQLCILKAYGRYASMVVRSNQNNIICGREVNIHPSYKVEFCREYNDRSQYVIEDGIAWVNIRSVKKPSVKQTTVYNFSVEEDESYTANNIIVHNCTTFSVAAISKHRRLNPETKNLDPISEYARFCDKTDQYCLWLISQLKPTFFFVENPRGAMRKMTWMQDLPRYTVTYCKYGDTRMKPTDIWTNHPDPQFKPPCKNGDPCHEPAPRGSRTGTQGRQGSVVRSLIPTELCDHIVEICERYIAGPTKVDEPASV